MLMSLNIKNYAIIDNINIDFSNGLNVITGETGAGKSIIVGALSLAIGYRSNSDMIRKGEDKIIVQALFELRRKNQDFLDILHENSIDPEDNMLLLSREININGRNICRINGTLVNVSTLKEISSYLVDIHGQHEHQRLLNKETHIEYIDSFGGDELKRQKDIVSKIYYDLIESKKNHHRLLEEAQLTKEKEDYYRSVAEEIHELNLQLDEDETIEQRITLLSNSEKIFELTNDTYHTLYNGESNALDILNIALKKFEKITEIDPSMDSLVKQFNEALISVEECVYSLRDYKDEIEFNPDELDHLQNRIHKINQLKRKYGETISDILEEAAQCEEKLKMIEDGQDRINAAEKHVQEIEQKYNKEAHILSSYRKDIANKFTERLIPLLHELGMNHAGFEVQFSKRDSFHPNGVDKIEFFIATNQGQEAKPLSKIASGGEISRIMLAIKNIAADLDATETLIFDEVDTGISGRTAQTVAEKLTTLGSSHQVLCITHLAQIASMADEHFLVSKHVENEQTYTQFNALTNDLRAHELARMLGGVEVTDTTIDHAKEMIRLAKEYKIQIKNQQ